jgi:mxaJ protein
MSGVMRRIAVGLLLLCSGSGSAQDFDLLRVCADPNNLPFSNRQEQGFENRLASLLAAELDSRVAYTWWAQRRGFVRHTLDAGACDVIMGVPSDFEQALTTKPYYRSSYVFVQRDDGTAAVRSLDDPRLHGWKIGVPIVGDDYANTPPAQALLRRGMVDNLIGYSVYGDYAQDSPPAELIHAIDRGEVDLAVAWGPLAGFFAARATHRLRLTPLRPTRDGAIPFRFAISIGVRRGDTTRKLRLERALARQKAQVQALLKTYGVPQL